MAGCRFKLFKPAAVYVNVEINWILRIRQTSNYKNRLCLSSKWRYLSYQGDYPDTIIQYTVECIFKRRAKSMQVVKIICIESCSLSRAICIIFGYYSVLSTDYVDEVPSVGERLYCM
jgi:hypothetical protein